MDKDKIETLLIGVICFCMAAWVAYMVIDSLETSPCKYTMADVPPGFEIVHSNGVYRARFKGADRILSPYSYNDTSLCSAIRRAIGQYEYLTNLTHDQNRKWEIVK